MLFLERPKRYFCRLLLFFLLVAFHPKCYAQPQQRYNRFQYHKYHWQALHTAAYSIYFPKGMDSACAYITETLPQAIKQVKKNMLTDVMQQPNIIIYPATDQLYESNIGSYETQHYTLPTFVYKGSRLLLIYRGSYADLKAQLYEALVRANWESRIREDDLQSQAKGGDNAKAPMWYKEGAIRYFAYEWRIQDEDQLQRTWTQNNFDNWQEVLNYEPRLAGQAFCYYLSEHYKGKVIAQVFFQLQKRKSLPRAVRLITKHTLDSLEVLCYDYYNNRYHTTTQKNQQLPQQNTEQITIPHKKGIITQVQVSRDKQYIAYTLTTYGKRTVYCYDTHNKTTGKITHYDLPPWIDDHSKDRYPLLQWSAKGNDLYLALPVKGKITIWQYTTTGHLINTMPVTGADGITSFTPMDNNRFLMAAFRRGQSDIVTYNGNRERYTAYTNDVYDDSHPLFNNKGQLLFVSDRPKERKPKVWKIGVGCDPDTLWQGIYTIRGKELSPIVIDTVWYQHWDNPTQISNNRILVTQTLYGSERYALLNSLTLLSPTYQTYQYLPQSQQLAFYKTTNDSLYLTLNNIDNWITQHKASPSDTTSPWLQDYRKRQQAQAKIDSILNSARDTTHSLLEDALVPKDARQQALHIKDSTARSLTYAPKKVKPYVLQLHSAYFSAKINNDYYINRYQPYLNYQGTFKFPEVGGLAQGGFTDLFENHHFTIGYRLPAGTEGSDFFVEYENTSRKVDWGLTYFRKVDMLQPDPKRNWTTPDGKQYPNSAKVKTHYYELSLHYPLSYDCSLGFRTGVREDRTIFLATDKYSLDFDDIKSVWSVNTLSYHINKLKPTLPYLYRGFEAKALLDVFKGFSQDEAAVMGSSVHISYHQPLYKYITLVVQAQAGYSAGDKKILYNIAGLDNNVTVRIDSDVHFSQTAPYAFQTLVTPFRGYYQNSVYGNQYTVFNADVYFPIFQTLIPIETPLPSINNLQLGIFTDAATARETWNANNPNNDRWLQSFGLSARTSLAGYPIKVDVAWPGSLSKQPVWYFSLSLK